MVFQDENPTQRLAECTDEGEKRFRAEKERLTPVTSIRRSEIRRQSRNCGNDDKIDE